MLATVSAGSLSTWLILAAVIGTAWMFHRGGGGTAIGSLEIANRVLEQRVQTLEKEGIAKDVQIAELQGRTDVTLATSSAIAPILEWSVSHERRAQERQEALLGVLQLIADSFGPDNHH